MDQALKTIAVPYLREKGYSGSYPHFRKRIDCVVGAVGFQFSQWGPDFYFEAGISRLKEEGGKETIKSEIRKIKYYNSWPRRRFGDQPISFENEKFKEIAEKMRKVVDEADAWITSGLQGTKS